MAMPQITPAQLHSKTGPTEFSSKECLVMVGNTHVRLFGLHFMTKLPKRTYIGVTTSKH